MRSRNAWLCLFLFKTDGGAPPTAASIAAWRKARARASLACAMIGAALACALAARGEAPSGALGQGAAAFAGAAAIASLILACELGRLAWDLGEASAAEAAPADRLAASDPGARAYLQAVARSGRRLSRQEVDMLAERDGARRMARGASGL